MTHADYTSPVEPVSPSEKPDAAIAVIDAAGTVVGWTEAAQQLVGYAARDMVGRSATRVLASPVDALGTSAFAEQCRAQGGWSGTVPLRHRHGHTLRMTLRISLLRGQDGDIRWLVSVTDIGALSSGEHRAGAGLAPVPCPDRHRRLRSSAALHLGE